MNWERIVVLAKVFAVSIHQGATNVSVSLVTLEMLDKDATVCVKLRLKAALILRIGAQ